MNCVVLVALIVKFSFALTIDENIPGHLKPLGHHGIPVKDGIDELVNFPIPNEFYKNYAANSKPFIVRGVLPSINFPAYKRWNDKYLREKYGNVNVNVEEGKRDIRSKDTYQMPMSKYLEIYKQAKMYMVHSTKDILKDDITLPISLQCGGLQNAVSDVIVWFSNGGTKSSLHLDEYENINCLLDGQKMFVMIDKKYRPEVESQYYSSIESKSEVDIDSVDLVKFPWLREVPWFQVNLTKGDCLYIPIRWYHYVYSPPGRNLAINFWSQNLRWFNDTDCWAKEENLKPLPLQKLEIKGENNASDQEYYRELFLKIFEDEETVSQSNFMSRMRKYAAGDITDIILSEVFEIIDVNHDMILSMYEFYVCDTAALEEIVPDGEIDNLFEGLFSNDDDYPRSTQIIITNNDDVSFLIKEKNHTQKSETNKPDNNITDDVTNRKLKGETKKEQGDIKEEL